jgi:hypothetical protein
MRYSIIACFSLALLVLWVSCKEGVADSASPNEDSKNPDTLAVVNDTLPNEKDTLPNNIDSIPEQQDSIDQDTIAVDTVDSIGIIHNEWDSILLSEEVIFDSCIAIGEAVCYSNKAQNYLFDISAYFSKNAKCNSIEDCKIAVSSCMMFGYSTLMIDSVKITYLADSLSSWRFSYPPIGGPCDIMEGLISPNCINNQCVFDN